jgi:hypothetical protein
MIMINWINVLPAYIDAKIILEPSLAERRAVTVRMLNQYAAVNNIPYGIMMSEIANQIFLQTGQTPAELLAQGITGIGEGEGAPENNSSGVPDWLLGVESIVNKIGNIFGLGGNRTGSGYIPPGSGGGSGSGGGIDAMLMSILPVAGIALLVYFLTKD